MKRILLILLMACSVSAVKPQTYSFTTFYGRGSGFIYSAEFRYLEKCVPLTYILTIDSMYATPNYYINDVFGGYDIFNRIVFYYLYRGNREGYFTTKIEYNLRAAQFPTMIGVDSTKGYFQCVSAQSSLPGDPPYTWKVYYF